jgi:signal transduction histidine kinase
MKRSPAAGFAWFKAHAHHLLFVSSLLSLVALSSWWAVFLSRAVRQESYLNSESIRVSVTLHATMIGHVPGRAPQVGSFGPDPRLEVTRTPVPDSPYARTLEPFWPGLYLQPREEVVRTLEDKTRSRTFMVIGESSLLVLLLLVHSFMLYRLIRAERRSTAEVHELWSRVTHEIKTPIAGIKAFLQTLRDQQMSREDLRCYVDMALKQVDRQQQLAENILIGRRLSRSGGRFNMTIVGLREFTKRFLESHALLLSGCDLRFRSNGDGEIPVSADPDALRVVMGNLVDNAVKYTSAGSAQISIEIGREPGNWACWSLTDNGLGFDPAKTENLFQAYHRLARELPGSQHGTGMGLHISRQLARRMGGRLDAASEGPGTGAVFTLRLRVAEGDR